MLLQLDRLPGRGVPLLVVFVSACAGGGSGTRTASRFGDIDRAEVVTAAGSTAFDVISQLRPAWLRPRGAPSLTDADPHPAVYLDGLYFGGIDDLRAVPANQLETARYLSASDATTRFGTDHASGAILVTTRSQ